jgi:dihydrofolate reductase
MSKTLHLIVACAENRVIGRDGKLPWQLPEDFKNFREKTAGQTVVLGRVCFETWPGASHDGREAVVVTRNHQLARHRVRVTPSFSAAIAIADTLPGEIYVCGGQRIYEDAMLLAAAPTRPIQLHLTLVHAEVPGDRFFPEWRHLAWRELSRRESADANYRYTFFELAR